MILTNQPSQISTEQYNIEIASRYCLIIDFLLLMVVIILLPIGSTVYVCIKIALILNYSGFVVIKLIFALLFIVGYVAIALMATLLIMGFIGMRITKQDTLSFSEDALVFANRENIFFKDMAQYYTRVIRSSSRDIRCGRAPYNYCFYFNTNRFPYAYRIRQVSKHVINNTPEQDKAFSDHLCRIIDQWQQAQS